MPTTRPSAQPVDTTTPTSVCFQCGRRTRGTDHEDYLGDARPRTRATWTKCRSADLKEHHLTQPNPAYFTDPRYAHPQMTRHRYERGPDWLDDDAPRRWGAALVWWNPTKDWVACIYQDGVMAVIESFEGRRDADRWFDAEVRKLRQQDDRSRPTPAELEAFPWNTDDDEDPPRPLR